MSETKQTKQVKHAPGPLPEGWKLKDGILTGADGAERYVLDGNGRIDRMKISIILDNYGFGFHSRAWIMTPLEAAAPELLAALRWAVSTWTMHPTLREPDLAACRAAIARAEGRS